MAPAPDGIRDEIERARLDLGLDFGDLLETAAPRPYARPAAPVAGAGLLACVRAWVARRARGRRG
jgi:hypothetical protein